MKKQNSTKKMPKKLGFSLIELSIVILVIGILVAGVTKGSSIMTKARIGSAKALTASSPAAVIPDLVAWYEPVLDSSFNPTNTFEGTTLTTGATTGASWYDNSPSKNNNATSIVGTPTYRESSINSLPTVRFNGSSSLAFNSSALNQKDYTVFIVEQRSAATSPTAGRFLDLGVNPLGYSATNLIQVGAAGTSVDVGAFSKATPRIITFLSGPLNSYTRGIFINGGSGSTSAVTASDTPITASAAGFIGKFITGPNYYTGDISEVIIYNRALKLDERNDIQGYLSKKYGIKVTTSS